MAYAITAQHTQSRTWRSSTSQITSEFRRVSNAVTRMRLDRSPFIPRTVGEYMRHKVEAAMCQAKERRTKMDQIQADIAVAATQNRGPFIPFSKGDFMYDRAAVLAIETIWSPLWRPTAERTQSPWPAPDEFKEEGDERHTSGFGRFLPIPRVPGNPTVVWKQKMFQVQYPMDQVHSVPRRLNIELPDDYELIEPSYDDYGNILDDENEPGNTTRAMDIAKELEGFQNAPGQDFTLADADEYLNAVQAGKKGRMQNASKRSPSFLFNPIVPDFVSSLAKHDGDSSTSEGSPFEVKRPRGHRNAQSADVKFVNESSNPFSALENLGFGDSESPEPLVDHAMKARNTALDFYLPDYMMEEEVEVVQEPTAKDDAHAAAIEKIQAERAIFKSFHLPAVGAMKFANAPIISTMPSHSPPKGDQRTTSASLSFYQNSQLAPTSLLGVQSTPLGVPRGKMQAPIGTRRPSQPIKESNPPFSSAQTQIKLGKPTLGELIQMKNTPLARHAHGRFPLVEEADDEDSDYELDHDQMGFHSPPETTGSRSPESHLAFRLGRFGL